MHALAFADSTRPARTVILRLPLRDYSIGHELILAAERNPLVILSGKDFTALQVMEQRQAVIRAVLTCSRGWIDRNKPHRWMRLWSWLNRKANYPLAIVDFMNYRAAGSTYPNLTKPSKIGQESGRIPGSPHLAGVLNFGFERYGERAFDEPLGMLQWLYFAKSEAEGCCYVENDLERDTFKEVDRLEAEILAEQAEHRKATNA